ncbi:MAG: serine hydrolase [Acidobacteria bacterium]|nr:serine hydrolase [Acidobacteriota bacterium]
MRIRPSPFGALLLVALVPAIVAAQTDPFEPIRETIRKEIATGTVPSLSLAVAQNGKIVWEEAFGLADVENNVPATVQTKYSLASISKPITATALMTLVEAGKIDLDKPIDDYLGGAKLKGYAGSASQATVRRVAGHVSGLPLHYHFFLDGEAYQRPSMAETIRRYGILVTPPGEKFQYANLGYGLLEYAIEQASGSAYGEFVEKHVFEPLGMKHSDVPAKAEPAPDRAVRYWGDDTPLPFYDFDHRGGSAVFASAHDLVLFGMSHLETLLPDQKAVLPRRRIEEMQKQVGKDDAPSQYGIGWMLYPKQGEYRLVHHGGVMGGVRANLSLIPSEKIAVVVLANRTSQVVDQIMGDILTTLLPRYGRRTAEERTPPADERGRDGSSNSAGTGMLPEQWTGEWSGTVHTYEGQLPIRLSITPAGEATAELAGQGSVSVSALKVEDGNLTGRFDGDIGTADASKREYDLRFSLQRSGDKLSGLVTALSVPGSKLSNALTSWVELRRD